MCVCHELQICEQKCKTQTQKSCGPEPGNAGSGPAELLHSREGHSSCRVGVWGGLPRLSGKTSVGIQVGLEMTLPWGSKGAVTGQALLLYENVMYHLTKAKVFICSLLKQILTEPCIRIFCLQVA